MGFVSQSRSASIVIDGTLNRVLVKNYTTNTRWLDREDVLQDGAAT